MDQEYQDWLGQVKPYDQSASVGSRLGYYVAISTAAAVVAPLLLPVWLLGRTGALETESFAGGDGSAQAEGTAQTLLNAGINVLKTKQVVSSTRSVEEEVETAPLPAWVGSGYSTVKDALWLTHDWLWAPVFGRGR